MLKQIRWVLILCVLSSAQVMASAQEDFFHSLLPHIQKTSHVVMAQRLKLKGIQAELKSHKTLTRADKQYVLNLASSYNLKGMDLSNDKDWTILLSRVDIIPTSMVLAQAADESAWGRSRFARLGYNYFGQWCFKAGCGFVPKQRAKGAHHEVRRFKNRDDAIHHYFHNLNTGATYEKMRKLRASMRQTGSQLSGTVMAKGLLHYSALGQKYVNDIQSIIRRYHLQRYD